MGRGRAKAKQTRVARDLKYRSFDTDFSALQRELNGEAYDDHEEELDDRYADLAAEYNDEHDDDNDEDERR